MRMYHTIKHAHSHLANQELSWFPMDTKERYIRHIETKKLTLEKYNWINNNFTYKFNSYGFRSEEFCKSNNMVSLGCSYTLGIGLPIENTWPYIVSNRLKLKNFNLGIAGGSNDSSFRIAYNWLRQLSPEIVVLMVTHPQRMEVVSEHDITQYSVHTEHSYPVEPLWAKWIMDNTNSETNTIKNIMAIQHLCHSLNIKLVITYRFKLPLIDVARDLSHPGIEYNKKRADDIYNIINGGLNPLMTCPYYNSIPLSAIY